MDYSDRSSMEEKMNADEEEEKLRLILILLTRRKMTTEHEKNILRLNSMHARHEEPIPVSAHKEMLSDDINTLIQTHISNDLLKSSLSEYSKFFDRTRLTVTEFFILHHRLAPRLRQARATSKSPIHPSPHITTSLLSTAEQLLLWMMAIQKTPIHSLEVLFNGVDDNTIFRVIEHVTLCINEEFNDEVQWPTVEQRKVLHGFFSLDDKIVAVLDGTHCEIDGPTYESHDFWNGRKKKHTLNYLVWVTVLGTIIHIEGPYPGRYNDRGCYNSSHFANHYNEYVLDDELVLADGGFMGGPPLIVPLHVNIMNKAKNAEEQEEMENFNVELSQNRVLVEDVFSWLKATARVLESRFTRAKHQHGKIFYAACKWYNARKLMRFNYANK